MTTAAVTVNTETKFHIITAAMKTISAYSVKKEESEKRGISTYLSISISFIVVSDSIIVS